MSGKKPLPEPTLTNIHMPQGHIQLMPQKSTNTFFCQHDSQIPDALYKNIANDSSINDLHDSDSCKVSLVDLTMN